MYIVEHQKPVPVIAEGKTNTTLDSLFQFTEDYSNPAFLLQRLDALETENPKEYRRLRRTIKNRLPKKTRINEKTIGIYLTELAFEQIETEETRPASDTEIYQHYKHSKEIDYIHATLDKKDLPNQPTPKQYAIKVYGTPLPIRKSIKQSESTKASSTKEKPKPNKRKSHNVSQEGRRRQGLAALRLWSDPIRSTEVKMKMSEAAKKRWKTKEYRDIMVASRKAEWERRTGKHQATESSEIEMAQGQSYSPEQTQPKPETQEPIANSIIDDEDMDLWEYASVHKLVGKIIKKGYLEQSEIDTLSDYFTGKLSKKQVGSLLNRFSIAVANVA